MAKQKTQIAVELTGIRKKNQLRLESKNKTRTAPDCLATVCYPMDNSLMGEHHAP